MKSKGDLPDWVVVTAAGLYCSICRDADDCGIVIPGAIRQQWRTEPCTSKNSRDAVRRHAQGDVSTSTAKKAKVRGGAPKESAHKQRRTLLTESVDEAHNLVSGLKKQLGKAESAITVRLGGQLHLCEELIANIKLKSTISLLHRNGGLESGPAPGEAGSFESKPANYTSNAIGDEFIYCLAAALDLWCGPIRNATPAYGIAGDETGVHNVSYHSILYSVVNLGVPGRPQPPPEFVGGRLILYGGTQPMLRGTSLAVFKSLIFQAEVIDGFKKQQLHSACFDTCNVMFGTTAGVAAQLVSHSYFVIARKCRSHGGALGDKHGLETHPGVKRAVENLIQYGTSSENSPKYAAMLGEGNELRGTSALAAKRPAATRWSSILREGKKLKHPEDYATHISTMLRAGQGGDADFFLLSAGAASATMNGRGYQLSDKVSRVAILLMDDLLPHSAAFITGTQNFSR